MLTAFLLLTLPFAFSPAAAQDFDASTAPVRIERITFTGNRTAETILRRRLPFTEGDPLGPASLKDARAALWDLRQFKAVEVSSSALPGGGAAVEIAVKDGWYLIPFPFYTGGSGGGRGGLLLFSRNIFRRSESVMASVFSGDGGTSSMLFLRQEGWSLGAVFRRRSVTEREYSDGAFSAGAGFGEPPDEKDPSRYGAVAQSYHKRTRAEAFSAAVPLARGRGGEPALSAGLGWEGSRLPRPSPRTPAGRGRRDSS